MARTRRLIPCSSSFSPECQDHFVPFRVIFCRPASERRVTFILVAEADEIASFYRVNRGLTKKN